MTRYYNPCTKAWETREELGERPADADTVLASEIAEEVFREIWVEVAKKVAAEEYPPTP
jgi:hypothetical protein